MPKPLPPLNALRAFEAAGRHLSFTRAAEELNVTPAAISHQIKVLEDYLGIQLFRRRPQGLLLTDAAQQALPAVIEHFNGLSAAVSILHRTDSERPLTVTVQPSFAAKWLVPRIERFRKRHPGIEVRIDATGDLTDFHSEDVDVGIRHGLGNYPGLHVERLPAQEVFPVCSPALLEADPPLRTPSDLRYHTLIHIQWDELSQVGAMADWTTWLASAGVTDVDPRAGPRYTHESMALQAAIEGHGVALVRTYIAAGDLIAGRLVRPFAHSLPEDFGHFLVCLPQTLETAKVAAFREWIHEELAADRETHTE